MMTDRWLNYVLSVVVVLGLVGVALYDAPRDRQERAELLDQDLTELDEDEDWQPVERDPVELQRRADRPGSDGPGDDRDQPGDDQDETGDGQEPSDDPAERGGEVLAEHGVSASHPAAVEVGMEVLAAGGNAVDAAVAVAYTLGVVEPFGSGIGGGGAMLVHTVDGGPVYYDYREVAPGSGELPASDIGVPGFVAGMDRIHEEHGSLEMAGLIEYAVRYAEDGVEVDAYLAERLEAATPRLPIHRLPRWFPDGQPIAAGATLRQPEYAQALRSIQDEGPEVMYTGELAEVIVDAVDGLEADDLSGYEVLEVVPAVGGFAGRQVVSGGAPSSGAPLVQLLQIAEERGIADLDLDGVDGIHEMAQAWRVASDQRTLHIGDPTQETVELDELLDRSYTDALADAISSDGFVPIEDDGIVSFETDTTHVVVIDREGTVVSMTNTLSNFFGSGLHVSGFFLNDQLKNFSPEPDSINHIAPGKRPRSFITPTIVLDTDGRPELALGSPGGRRIPNVVAQVLVRWAAHGEPLEDAVLAPRFHLEGATLELERSLDGAATDRLAAIGYEPTTDVATSEYFGGVQLLRIDWDDRVVLGVDDPRRTGTWDAASD